MSTNPLNDISKIYLEKIVEKKDDSYLETDMKKRRKNNEKAVEDMKKVKDDTVPRWMKEAKKADKDYDGDGEIESGTDEYMGPTKLFSGSSSKIHVFCSSCLFFLVFLSCFHRFFSCSLRLEGFP